ncbi:MAG: DUF1573 domain-containing protein [Kiritimatiellae bacterium]|nr:DUF1573 domain-containing protein [Kiritimatiellia bacterium]MDD5522426.1 DUF1573 domain-containing protein [Kiritimatiellia bacterium]
MVNSRDEPLDPPLIKNGAPGGHALPLAVGFRKDLNTAGGMEVIGSDTVDFGKYPAREKKVANFKIRNSGRETVKIRKIYKTCGCATAVCDKTELKAGEKANVEIVILPNSIFGAYSKPTYIESTDINNQFLSMTVKGTAVPLVEIKPQDFLYVGRIDTNRQWLQSFDISATEPGVKLGEPNVKCNYPVETVMNLLSAKEPVQYKLEMKLMPSTASGDFQCSISIPVINPTDNPPVVMGISGKIGTEMIAFPGTFRMSISSNDIVRKFNLKVLGEKSKVLDPEQVKLPEEKGVTCEVKQADDGRSIAVTAKFSPDFTKELFAQGKIYLPFSVPGISSARVLCLSEKNQNLSPR